MFAWLLGTSLTKSEAQIEAEKRFTKAELKALERQFHGIHAIKGDMSIDAFQHQLCGLPVADDCDGLAMGKAFWRVVSQRKDSVHLSDVIIAKARAERMGREEALAFTFGILCSLGDMAMEQGKGCLSTASASMGLRACLKLCGVSYTEEVVELGHVLSGMSSSPDGSISLDDYTRFHKSFPALHDSLTSLLSQLQPVSESLWSKGLPKMSPQWVKTLLRPSDAWLLASCLSPELTRDWTLIFNSNKDGMSFNAMMGRLGRCIAPSLVVIRDKGGFCFGGFAPMPWVKSGQHFGDASTFVFGLRPNLSISRATGMNSSYQWCGMGFSQLANGIGFGGSQGAHSGHFSVFVDSNLEKGMSRPISTFGNECLASSQVFEIDTVECWQLRANEEEPEIQRRGGGALSEKNAVDRAFLATAGIQVNHSAGLSNEPIE